VESVERHADGQVTATALLLAAIAALESDGVGLPCGEKDATQAAAASAAATWRLVNAGLLEAHAEAQRRMREACQQAKLAEPEQQGPSRSAVAFALAANAATASVVASEAKEKVSQEGLRAERERLLATASHFLRDLVANPFRPRPTIQAAWLSWSGGTVRHLAEAIYQERSLPEGHLDLTRLAVLADALEDAGCADPDLLGHLRGAGPHVRGCWATDLLLGKE
jgi:hypothetical protein